MTLSETITKIHNTLIENNEKEISAIDAEEAVQLFEELIQQPYNVLAEEDGESALMFLLYQSAKAYGEAKWNEGVEAARNSICEDKSTPPKFIP